MLGLLRWDTLAVPLDSFSGQAVRCYWRGGSSKRERVVWIDQHVGITVQAHAVLPA